MSSSDQKCKERSHLDRLIELAQLDVVAVVETERPDFVLQFADGRRIGVEHTEARQHNQVVGGAAIRGLKEALRTELEGRAVQCWIHFSCGSEPASLLANKKARRLLAKKIVDVSLRIQPDAAGRRELREHELDVAGLSPLQHLTVDAHDKARATWSSSGRGPGAHVIQASLASKGSKLETYRSNVDVDEVWLLIVSGTGAGSVDICVADVEFRANGYDRAFFLDLYHNDFVDLSLTT